MEGALDVQSTPFSEVAQRVEHQRQIETDGGCGWVRGLIRRVGGLRHGKSRYLSEDDESSGAKRCGEEGDEAGRR